MRGREIDGAARIGCRIVMIMSRAPVVRRKTSRIIPLPAGGDPLGGIPKDKRCYVAFRQHGRNSVAEIAAIVPRKYVTV